MALNLFEHLSPVDTESERHLVRYLLYNTRNMTSPELATSNSAKYSSVIRAYPYLLI